MDYIEINDVECYTGKPTHIHGMTMKRIKKSQDCCPFCTLSFKESEYLSLIMCNNKLFPNKFVHSSCLNRTSLFEVSSLLARSYSEFLDDKVKFEQKHWRWK